MANSSIPAVIDYLLATLRALSIVTNPTTPVQVFDGFPGPSIPDDFVAIGGGSFPTANGPEDWAAIGALKRDEDYLVEIAISAYRGGSSDSNNPLDSSNAQKTARDRAFAIWSAIDGAVRGTQAKVTLGPPGSPTINMWSGITDITVEQTDVNDPNALMGRRCTIVFYLHVRNRI